MLKQRIGTPVTKSAANYYGWRAQNGTWSWSSGQDWSYIPTYETMLDETYSRFHQTNACTHVKWDQTYENTPFVYRIDSDRSTPATYYEISSKQLRYQTGGYTESTSDIVDEWFGRAYPGLDPLNASWRDLYARGLQSMWPKIEKQFDETIANSAYESPQILSLFLTSSGRVKKVASLLRQTGKSGLALMTALGSKKFIASKGEWLRLIMGSTARADLTWEFGLRPLIDDIVTIHNSVKRVKQDLQRLVSNQNRILRSHWSTIVPVGSLAPVTVKTWNTGNPPYLSDESGKAIASAYVLQSKYTASLKYSYTIRPSAVANLQLTAFLDAYGIGGMGDPQMLWNALPFSFVVDYFAHVGNFLHQFSDRGIQPSVNILDASHSYSLKYTRQLDIQVSGAYGTGGKSTEHVRNYSFYQRERPAPNQVSQIALRGFSKRNIRYLGTLFAAMKL